MPLLEQVIISGAIISSIYAVVALGFTLIYGVSGIINLTHGAFFMIGAYIYGAFHTYFSSLFPAEFSYMAPVLALIVTPILTGIIGSIFYRLTFHQVLGDQIATLVVSICGCIFFQQIIWIIFGSVSAFRLPIPPMITGTFTIIGVSVVSPQALAAVLSLVLFAGVWIFILGGLGSIKGTLIGAFIFGYSIAYITLTGGGGLVTSFPFIVMIVVLIIRPKGLFGKRVEME
jgi:branched-chain amino acid transport system permease protein